MQRGGGGTFHTVINGENLHALQLLGFTHRKKIDAIYIDPPYNTGNTDWKYNNDYVDRNDNCRHSKWLAFMERRLLLARDLLNPECSILIVTIDSNEYLRLGLLLEQIFPNAARGQDAQMQMISTVINKRGTSKGNEFSQIDEYIFFLWFGNMKFSESLEKNESSKVSWYSLRRDDNPRKEDGRKNQFYPIYINESDGKISGVGDPLPKDMDRKAVPTMEGCISVFPIRPDGTEVIWGLTPESFLNRFREGYVRVGRSHKNKMQPYAISHLQSGVIESIKRGDIVKLGKRTKDDSVIVQYVKPKNIVPKTQWSYDLHDAGNHGTKLLKNLIPNHKFPFPKSIYAVEDCLRLFLSDKPNATVLDFFAGSGTTCHAVMKMNLRDGGSRQCISITNNEVGLRNEKQLSRMGYRPGDPEWDKHGICEQITIPRILAAISGLNSEGKPISEYYKKIKKVELKCQDDEGKKGKKSKKIKKVIANSIVDDFPINNGLSQSVAFFKLCYMKRILIEHNIAFESLAPLLWMRAGSVGSIIKSWPAENGWEIADTYGIVIDLDKSADFLKAVDEKPQVMVVYVVSDRSDRYHMLTKKLKPHIDVVDLWESYLINFEAGDGQ